MLDCRCKAGLNGPSFISCLYILLIINLYCFFFCLFFGVFFLRKTKLCNGLCYIHLLSPETSIVPFTFSPCFYLFIYVFKADDVFFFCPRFTEKLKLSKGGIMWCDVARFSSRCPSLFCWATCLMSVSSSALQDKLPNSWEVKRQDERISDKDKIQHGFELNVWVKFGHFKSCITFFFTTLYSRGRSCAS